MEIGAYGYSSMDYYRRVTGEHPVLPYEEVVALIERYQKSGDGQAREKIIFHNMGFIFKRARQYWAGRVDVSIDDLISAGVIGLMRAADLFDPKRGLRFLTYADFWIRQKMRLELALLANPVYMPPHKFAVLWRARKARRDMLNISVFPSDEKIAKKIGFSVEDVRYALMVGDRAPLSLDERIERGSGRARLRHEFIPDAKLISPVTRSLAQGTLREIERKIDSLHWALSRIGEEYPRRVVIFRAYYGLEDRIGRKHKLAEVAKRFAVTTQRVHEVCRIVWEHVAKSYPDLDMDADKLSELRDQWNAIASALGLEAHLLGRKF